MEKKMQYNQTATPKPSKKCMLSYCQILLQEAVLRINPSYYSVSKTFPLQNVNYFGTIFK